MPTSKEENSKELFDQQLRVAVEIYQVQRNLIYLPNLRDRKSEQQLMEYLYREFHELVFRYLAFQELQIRGHAPARYERYDKDISRALYQIALTKFLYKPSALPQPLYLHH